MKITRIFEVEYYSVELINGRREKDATVITEKRNVVAKNATAAAESVRLILSKTSFSWVDDETKKKMVATRADYDPICVKLLAEA